MEKKKILLFLCYSWLNYILLALGLFLIVGGLFIELSIVSLFGCIPILLWLLLMKFFGLLKIEES